MATSNYQNHFLQRGRFNAGSTPNVKKSTANPNLTAAGLTALRLAPVMAPYAKKLYDSYELNKASNYLDDVVAPKYIDPLTGKVVDYDTGYKLHPLSKAGDSLSKTSTERLQEGLFGKQPEYSPDYVMDDRGLISQTTPVTDKLLENNPYDATSYYNETGMLPEVNVPAVASNIPVDTYAELTSNQMSPITPEEMSGWLSYDGGYGSGGSDFSSVNSGLGDWNTLPTDYVSPTDYYSGMPSSDSLVTNWGDSVGDWSSGGAGGAVDASQAATWDAAAGEFVGPGTGTDGFAGGWGEGFGGAGTAGLMSIGSDLFSGRDINVGKAAGAAGGAYGGAALGTAIFPGPGTLIGGALGSMFGGAVGGGGKVICTELHRQGLLSDRIMELDDLFGKQQDPDVVAGYHYWAKPLANLMRRSKIVTWIVKPFVRSWAQTMAAAMSPGEFKPTLLGRGMMKFGKFICKWLGKRINKRNSSEDK